MIHIAFLVDHPDAIPTLTSWFQAQWPDYYARRTPAEIAQDFCAEAKRGGLPVRLVAFVDGELAGTITLREEATNKLPGYSPALGGLFVAERHRGRGIGTELIRAAMDLAREQGFGTLYTATVAARGIVERLGWALVRTVWEEDEQLVIYRYDLEERGSPGDAADPP